MNTTHSTQRIGDGLGAIWRDLTRGKRLNRGATWGFMIVGALLAFELFNFSTTEFALRDILGNLTFAGFRWATVLAIAFCGIDFAGIARIFTPQEGRDEPAEVWYLFGAWLLAAGFNAALTWWGVSVAIVSHGASASAAVVGSHTLTKVVPVFVAVMVLLIRVLIIGTFSVGGDKLFSTAVPGHPTSRSYQPAALRSAMHPAAGPRSASSLPQAAPSPYRAVPKPSTLSGFDGAEPTYQPLSFDAGSQESHREPRLQ